MFVYNLAVNMQLNILKKSFAAFPLLREWTEALFEAEDTIKASNNGNMTSLLNILKKRRSMPNILRYAEKAETVTVKPTTAQHL